MLENLDDVVVKACLVPCHDGTRDLEALHLDIAHHLSELIDLVNTHGSDLFRLDVDILFELLEVVSVWPIGEENLAPLFDFLGRFILECELLLRQLGKADEVFILLIQSLSLLEGDLLSGVFWHVLYLVKGNHLLFDKVCLPHCVLLVMLHEGLEWVLIA